MSSSPFKAYEKCILQHPRMALIFVLAIAVMMATGLQNFKIDASADALTLELDEDLNYYRELVRRYGASNYLVVTYNPKDENLFDDKVLVHLQSLIDDLVAVPGVTGSLSILDVPLLYSPKISVADFSDELRTLLTPGVNRSLAKQEFLDSPIYKNTILSSDGQTTGIMLNLELDQLYLSLVKTRDTLRQRRAERPLTDEESEELDRISKEFLDHRTDQTLKNQRLIAEIRAVTSAYKDKATIFLGGPDMITVDMVDFLKSDLIVFGNGILIFIIFTLVLIFRRMHWVVLPLVNCAACIVIMLGFFSWIDWRLTVISSNFVSLLMIVTLALTIHLIVRYRELSSQKPKAEQIQLVTETVSSMTRPCLYTVLTTAVAFASLVVSNIRPVIDFGWMMTLGIFVALAISFIVIPAGMMLIGRKPDRHHEDSVSITRVFAAFTERYGNVVLGASLILAGLATFGISKLEVENRFIDYFHSDTEIYRGMETIDTSLGGTTPLDIVIQAPSQGMLQGSNDTHDSLDVFEDDASSDYDPELDEYEEYEEYEDNAFDLTDNGNEEAVSSYWFSSTGLDDLGKFHAFLEDQPEIGKVNSLAQLYQVANDLSGHKLNDFELAFLRKSLSPEIFKQLVGPYLIEELDETRIQLRTMETSGDLRRAELIEKIRLYAVNELKIDDENIRFSGLLVLYNNMLQSLYQSQILTLGAVFMGIMFMFIVLFRSIKISLIAVIPNLLAAGIVLGGMGIAQIPLDMMTITIAAITVGIGVDHAIHYLTRFKKEFGTDQDYVASMYRSHASIGRALFYTAITIIVGFSILALSNFIPSIYFGLLTGLAMIAALLGSMTLLPKLILLSKPFGPGAGLS